MGWYFILMIGQSNNRIHILRQGCNSCLGLQTIEKHGLLSCTEFRKFWVTWTTTGHISFGSGSLVHNETVIQYRSQFAITPNYLIVGTSGCPMAKWKFYVGKSYLNCTVVMSSVNGLIGTEFASWYRLQPRAGF